MNVSTKRLLSILLSLAMVLAILPMAVFAETPTTLYVQPNDNWKVDNARFAAVLATEGWTAQVWVDATDEDGDGVYEVAIPDDGNAYAIVIFCRMNPNNAANGWDNKWNQTADLTIPTDGNNCYIVAPNTWDKGNGQWTTYTAEGGVGETEPTTASPIEYSVAGVSELCGSNWTPEDINNMMTDEDGDGVYTLTYENVAAGTYEFKVTNGTWNESWGKDGGNDNYVLTLDATATVEIRFDSATKLITVVINGEEIVPSEPSEDPSEDSSEESSEPFVPGVNEYCLVGYINGADYGCNADYENVGEYIFVDGTLTTSFTSDSYVFLKTTDNANWYLTETFCSETTGTFVKNGTEKMIVPGNVEITFTLVENEDGTLTLSYVTGDPIETEPSDPSDPSDSSDPSDPVDPADPTYYVAGSFNGWNAADEAYLMTANEDGTYALTFAVTAGEIQLKVTGGDWGDGNNWGDNGNNIVVNAITDGEITVTFNPADYSITVTGDCLGEVEKEPLVINTIHVAGSAGLCGTEWDASANVMTNTDGVYTITFTDIDAGTYELKFLANGAWDLNWASGIEMISGEVQTAWIKPLGNSTLNVAEDGSTVTLTFDTTNMDPYTGEGATSLAVVEAPAVEPSTAPTVGLKYPSLSFEDVIIMNVYYTATDLEDVVEMGLITNVEKPETPSVETADQIIPGYTWSESDGFYFSSTAGIAPKDLGDTIYFAVYWKLADGTYGYTRMIGYSPKTYALNQLTTGSAEMRPLVAAMLNYGAAAQNYFNYKTDALVNATMTDEQKAMAESYRDDMIATVTQASGAKLGEFVNDKTYTKRYPTISFEGAFCINYYFLPTLAVEGDVTMYIWSLEDYEAAEVLTKENATKAVKMELTESGEYLGVVDGIAAKDLDKAAYVTFCYNDGTADHCGGVLAYTIGMYCKSQASKTGTLAELAKACAVYGYYAKQLFNK